MRTALTWPRRAPVLGVSLALALLLLCGTSARARPSTYSARSGGAKVFYLLIEDLGYRVKRVFDLRGPPEKTDVLVHMSPSKTAPTDKILSWVREGHLLILALPLGGLGSHCGEFKYGSITLKRTFSSKSSGKKIGHEDLEIKRAACLLKVPDGARIVLGKKGAALALHMPLDKGKILILAHDDLLTNSSLNGDDTVVAIRRWMDGNAPARGRVTFLEERKMTNVVQIIRKTHLGAFVIHGLVFLLLLYWCLLPRHGDPREVQAQTRREFSQHARALGHLYQRRRASAHALKQQYSRFLDRVFGRGDTGRRNFGLKAGASRQTDQSRSALADRIATRTGKDAADVDSLLAQVEYSIQNTDAADSKQVLRHFRLSQALADLQHSSAARTIGGKRGRTKNR